MSHIDYDAIIIGSGAGGMSAAVALANAGQKVLVCEQHYVAGGWTHSFTLQGYRFSPGVHYIGGLGPGGMMQMIYCGLGVSGDLAFCELNPDGFDHVIAGDQRFDIPKGEEIYKERLKQRFPKEAKGIDTLFAEIRRMTAGIRQIGTLQPSRNSLSVLRWFWSNTQAFVDSHVSDPFLKAILLSQTGDHGVPPSRVPPPVHVSVMDHYFNGGYYPMGGAFTIPRAFVRALKRKGGEIKLRTKIERILIEDGKAIGVRFADGTEARAKAIVSNADPHITLGQMVGPEHLSGRTRRKLDKATYSTSCLSLFFAVDMDLKAEGLDSGNVWWYNDSNVDRIYREGMTSRNLGDDPIEGLFLTATTLKDPAKMHSGHHTLEAFSFVGYDAFKKWEQGHDSEGGSRPGQYADLKEHLTDKMFDAVEKVVPGIRRHVVFAELGTPLTNQFYLNATRGNLYGTDKVAGQIGPFAFQTRTEIEGLYMVGASTLSHGVAGATASGLAAAKEILNCRMRDLLAQRGKDVPVYPSEDVSAWPAELQARIARSGVKVGDTDEELAEISDPA
jgi:phytoene dehydrogenase-like protein